MEIFGMMIPLWAIFLGVILIIIAAWKIIKFAIKLFVILIIILTVFVGLDITGILDIIKDIIISII